MSNEMIVSAIGHIEANDDGYAVVLAAPFRRGLAELDGFSHVNVLWWADRADERSRATLQYERPYRLGPASVGVFATRAPARPNPIAITPVAVLDIDAREGRIRVPYIDAADGTPVLDIKPYHPSMDRIRDARAPSWCAHWPQWYEDSAQFDWAAEFTQTP